MSNSYQELAPSASGPVGAPADPKVHRMNQDVPTAIAKPIMNSVQQKFLQHNTQVDAGEIPMAGHGFDTPNPAALHEPGAATSSTHSYKDNSRIGHIVHPTRI